MATRYQTYELTEGVFGTFDSQNEPMPTEYLNGPFDVNTTEAAKIENGAAIEINETGTDIVVTVPVVKP